MTDHNDTGATARPWREALRREPERYAACSPEAISHGSQAQMKYFVADAQHDIAILATRLAEVERELVRERQTSRGDWSSQRDNDALIIDLDEMKTRALAAEARIAVLEKALEFYANSEIYKPHPHGAAFDRRDKSYIARTALAAEQKEAGK